jgi:dynein heavy chain
MLPKLCIKTSTNLVNTVDLLRVNGQREITVWNVNVDSYQTNMANEMLATIVSIQPKDSGGSGGETRESVVYRLADDMLSKLPADYVPHEVCHSLASLIATQLILAVLAYKSTFKLMN